VAHNTTIEDMDVTAYAEMKAIREACRKLKTTNLSGCVIYATFKPCPMCQAACERANISRIYYGVGPEDIGASPREYKTLITAGFLKNECLELVQRR
jgi:tRNA(Arg) A34 adenosine deaminase TadA